MGNGKFAPQLDQLCNLSLNAGMLGVLVFTPLAFGAVHVWAFSLLEMSVFFLLALWTGRALLHQVVQGHPSDLSHVCSRRVLALVSPIVLFVGLVLLQLTPLPPALLHSLSPATYRLYHTAVPDWPQSEQHQIRSIATSAEAGALVSSNAHHSSSWRPLSFYPPASRMELLKLLTYLAFFALVAVGNFSLFSWHGVRARGAPPVVFALIILSTGLALLAFLQQATWNGKLLWFFVPYDWSGPQTGNESRLHGPFVNPDHFAGYLEMIVPLAVAAALVYGRRLWLQAAGRQGTPEFPSPLMREGQGEGEKRPLDPLSLTLSRQGREKYSAAVQTRSRSQRKTGSARGKKLRLSTRIVHLADNLSFSHLFFCGLFTLAAIIVLTALVFTLSRGAFSAVFGGLFFMAWLLWPFSKRKSPAERSSRLLLNLGRVACLLGLLSVPVIYLEYPQLFGRFLQMPQELDVGRPVVYAATLELWRDFPLWGVGLGNFQEAFLHYQPAEGGQGVYDHAHSDYLELLAETGIVGFVLMMWALGSVLWRATRSWQQATAEQQLWLAGILAGVVAMLLHSLVDFNLHIPSNALLLLTLLALSVQLSRAVNRREEERGNSSEPRPAAAWAVQ